MMEDSTRIADDISAMQKKSVITPEKCTDIKIREQIELAGLRKEEGNKLVKEKSYQSALGKYHLAVFGIRSMTHLTTEQSKEADSLLISCLGNMSFCYIKLCNWDKTIQTANKLLEKDPKNIKGIFRRGQACLYKGILDQAESDIQSALEVIPTDPVVKEAYKLLQEKRVSQVTKDRTSAKKMFSR